MMIYIQLLKDTGILEDNGVIRRKSGEWLEVQRNVAIRLLIEGRARVLDYPALLTEYGDVEMAIGHDGKHNTCNLFDIACMQNQKPDNLPFEVSNHIYLGHELADPITILVGLQALQNWHVAIPLLGNLMTDNLTNKGIVDEITKEIIRDLRVPAYNPDIIFYRNSDHAKRFLEDYAMQLQLANRSTPKMIRGVTPVHALIRSLYITKPYHIALPAGSIR